MTRPDKRNQRTEDAIKDALLTLLQERSLRDLSVTEVARKAQVSRSTFYAHFNNLDEVREHVVRDYFESLSSLRAQMHSQGSCLECTDRQPFCSSLRSTKKYRPLVSDPRFIGEFLDAVGKNDDLYAQALGGTFAPSTIKALRRFQLYGCYAAAMGAHTDQEWDEAQQAIDDFIRGGLAALRQKRGPS